MIIAKRTKTVRRPAHLKEVLVSSRRTYPLNLWLSIIQPTSTNHLSPIYRNQYPGLKARIMSMAVYNWMWLRRGRIKTKMNRRWPTTTKLAWVIHRRAPIKKYKSIKCRPKGKSCPQKWGTPWTLVRRPISFRRVITAVVRNSPQYCHTSRQLKTFSRKIIRMTKK